MSQGQAGDTQSRKVSVHDALHVDQEFLDTVIDSLKLNVQKAVEAHDGTLVSAVDEDDLFSVESPVQLHNTLANSNLAIIPGKRHAFQNVNLELMVPLVRRHFDQR